MKKLLIALTLGAAAAASAQVTLSNATLWQNPQTRVVEVTYELTGGAEPVYITLDITTNTVAIPTPTSVSGDVTTMWNPKTIAPDSTPKKILWEAKKDWPGELTTNAQAVVTAWFTTDPPPGLLFLSSTPYVVVDLSGGPSAPSYPVWTSTVPPDASALSKTTELWLRRIPKGTFTMGSPNGELGKTPRETQHQVTLTKDFFIGVFHVTQQQYALVMGSNPSGLTGLTRPVDTVSYLDLRGATLGAQWPASNDVDAGTFLWQLRKKTGLTFDLPTEAQWEYACRAGTATSLNSGLDITEARAPCPNVEEVARYAFNSGYNGSVCDNKGGYTLTTTVGLYEPNNWGLYDMHGNVWEWCLDRYVEDLTSAAVEDPKGPASGNERTIRGGAFNSVPDDLRAAFRYYNGFPPELKGNSLGFRVCIQP